MIRGIEKKRIVLDEQDRKDFVRRLGLLAVETKTAVYAWAAVGLAKFMRRLLTGYAVGYNLRHRRH